VTVPIAEILNDLRPVRRPAKILYVGAAFWLLSAVIHLGAVALDGWDLSGAVSFRKPLVFSLSVGLLLATVGWVLDRLPDRPRLAGALAWTFLVSSTIEVALIAMQTWRGRASHFNVFEANDALIFIVMGVSVGVMSLCLIGALIWSAIERPSDRLVRLAVIGGLAVVATGLGIGQWIIELGNDYVEANQEVPDTVVYGEEGVVKFPHAVAFHGIQIFIVSAVMLRRGHLAEKTKRRLLHLVFWSYVAALAFASAQTVVGRAPFDVSVWSLGLAASLGGVGYGLIKIVRGLGGSMSDDREGPLAVP
jgi:hypothetical protein